MTFSQFAQLKRKQAGLSQDTIAKAMGFAHRAEVSRKESGKIEWKLGEVITLAHLLDMRPGDLLNEWQGENVR